MDWRGNCNKEWYLSFKIILHKKDKLIPRKFSLEMQLQTFRMPKIIIRQLRKDGFKGK
jgi:hypothetical protein